MACSERFHRPWWGMTRQSTERERKRHGGTTNVLFALGRCAMTPVGAGRHWYPRWACEACQHSCTEIADSTVHGLVYAIVRSTADRNGLLALGSKMVPMYSVNHAKNALLHSACGQGMSHLPGPRTRQANSWVGPGSRLFDPDYSPSRAETDASATSSSTATSSSRKSNIPLAAAAALLLDPSFVCKPELVHTDSGSLQSVARDKVRGTRRSSHHPSATDLCSECTQHRVHEEGYHAQHQPEDAMAQPDTSVQ